MDKKEYTTNTCDFKYNTDINSDFKYNIDDHFNWPNDYWNKFAWCQYLLPCGLCEKTMQQCPKYQPNQFQIIYTNMTIGNTTTTKDTSIIGTFTTGDSSDD